MRTGRSIGLAMVALVAAMVPGALRVDAPSARPLDRAASIGAGDRSVAPQVVQATPAEVPMTPPPADLRGDLAPAVPVATTFSASGSAVDGEVLALVIGIDDYPGRRSDLEAAVADADTIDAALSGFGVPAGNRLVLRNGQARRDSVVDAIRALVARATDRSTVVFAYAGHVRKLGPGREALVTADGGLITDDELAVLLAPTTAPRMWLLLATCYAGGFTEVLAPGRILTGASGANEIAYESPDLKASFLVHHLVREGWLEGAAGPSVQEAFAYADAALASTRPARRPVQTDDLGEPLLLGAGDPAAAAVAEGPASSSAEQRDPQAPPENAEEPAPQPQPPPPSREAESECTLGVLLCRKR